MRAARLLLLVAGCNAGPPSPVQLCQDDTQCSAPQICFPEGCGDPGAGLVVEVTANTRSGFHAQDVEIASGALRATHDLQIQGPLSLVGEIHRNAEPINGISAVSTVPFTGAVTVRAVGQSAKVPGVTRRYEATFSALERGAYSVFVGMGRFTVTAQALDTSIPPSSAIDVTIETVPDKPRQVTNQDFLFRALGETRVLTGRLLRTYIAGTPAVETPITQAEIDLQAFDPVRNVPLSQAVPVSSGHSGSTGDFTLYLDPSVDKLGAFQLLAVPRQSGSAVPSKSFILEHDRTPPLVLEMGEYGELVPVTGTLRATDGQPVSGATVHLEGVVNGGGIFRSQQVTTDGYGVFKTEALPSAPNSAYTLIAAPPQSSTAGILDIKVKVLATPNEKNEYLAPSSFVCPDRVPVSGVLLRPDGQSPAVGARVIAQAIDDLDERPLPPDPIEVATDATGRYTLYLDPAVYRIDYVPEVSLPRRSRQITVKAEPALEGKGLKSMDLGSYTLTNGRRVTGTVTSTQPLMSTTRAAANASIRFFRVTSVGGKRSSVLLGQTVADESGNYAVTLPSSR
ncbi:MAG: carboxypeptidase-like regulatory domain-containing protein [Myxococcota bacterium]